MRTQRNKHLLTLLLAVLFALLLEGESYAQTQAYVAIRTNLPEATVYVDSVALGPASSGVLAVPAGAAHVRLVPPGHGSWSVPPVEAPLTVAAGDTVDVRLDFPHHYRVESVPFGASVYVETERGRELLGKTPLYHTTPAPLPGRLVVEHPGYVIVRLEPGDDVWNAHSLSLSPEQDADPTAARVPWEPPRPPRRWIDYAAVGTAVAAGALAIHYKFKADNLYDDYVETTDPALRPQIREYDTYSAVSLGVMQAGIGLFAIRLALR